PSIARTMSRPSATPIRWFGGRVTSLAGGSCVAKPLATMDTDVVSICAAESRALGGLGAAKPLGTSLVSGSGVAKPLATIELDGDGISAVSSSGFVLGTDTRWV